MSKLPLRIPVLVFSVLGYFAVAGLSGQGAVWCFGADGHVAVETAHVTTAQSNVPASLVASRFELSVKNQHLGPCFDVPVANAFDGPALVSENVHRTNSHGAAIPISCTTLSQGNAEQRLAVPRLTTLNAVPLVRSTDVLRI